jgi:hypothetical protein
MEFLSVIDGLFADFDPPQTFADEILGNERQMVVGERCKQSQRLQRDLACPLLASDAKLPRRAARPLPPTWTSPRRGV